MQKQQFKKRFDPSIKKSQQLGNTSDKIDFKAGGGRPLQIIQYDERMRKFVFNEEVIKHLSKYEGNVGFVTITGPYRSGKSFLTNKLLGLTKNNGMIVNPNVETCTKGIWIWSQPVHSEKDNKYLFFLDAEGSGATSKDE